ETEDHGRFGIDYTVKPREDVSLKDLLHEAVQNIRGTYREAELPDLGEGEAIRKTIPADPDVRNFSYTLVDGELYYRENSIMVRPDLNATAEARVKGMVGLRDCVRNLLDEQLNDAPDTVIRAIQTELNERYDEFSAKYGLINDRANRLAFADDSSYYLLCSLEILNEERQLKQKAEIFTRRTIQPHRAAEHVDTAAEALAVSISEKARVDMAYMTALSGKSEEELETDLRGAVFRLPEQPDVFVTADEYLSGNVRQKLAEAERAAEGNPLFAYNAEALHAAQPRDLEASEIEVRLGATWIEPETVKDFMFDLLQPGFFARRGMDVEYSGITGEWKIKNKSLDDSSVNATVTYGTSRASAYRILEDSLNLRDVRIFDIERDPEGRETRKLNSEETTLAQQKQQVIKDKFREWIFDDPDRRRYYVRKYNDLFNSDRPREYNGEHLTLGGMNPEIRLWDHQRNAVAHILYGGNTLLAHEVGAGKTYEMAAACMESKRLGLSTKALFAVPNHLTEQWASEFLRLYPSANILVTTKKDFEPANRKKFCARIATGSYDAIIMGHSQFEKIPMSQERQEALLRQQIKEIEDGIEDLKRSRGERSSIKDLERTRKSLEAKLEKLLDKPRDDVVTFEQLGVDRLFVDEAHNYKNLFLYTKMRNVAGLSTTDAQKSSDMYLKCRYLDEITGGKGVIFATGTPVSNSMTELYTMMRYLQHDMLDRKGMSHFDSWAATFGETQTAIELAPEGTGYRARTRFAKFFNLPELMNLFREAADIKTSDQLHLPVPEAEFHNIVAKPTEIQQEMVKQLSERASAVHSRQVDPKTDNMLAITSDGRKLGLDQRIVNPNLPDDPGSKVNLCVNNVFRIWEEGTPDKLTQLVFCDLSTPKKAPAPPKPTRIDDPELHADRRTLHGI
ncbi:MAG: DEAD/DEAH box helicase family protein, partial [Clostridia bacterium]|nr:DEAD/DEAH box helicase family protein [Clostridia bacterium]